MPAAEAGTTFHRRSTPPIFDTGATGRGGLARATAEACWNCGRARRHIA